MITGVHAIVFSDNADPVRRFFADVLGLPSVDRTLDELAAKGVTATQEITDQGWGLLSAIGLPDGTELAIYQSRHPSPAGPGQ